MQTEALSLPALLRERAGEMPDRPYLQEVDGPVATYSAAFDEALRWCAAFRSAGLERGDVVLSMLPTSIAAVVSWLGATWAGAIETAVNLELKGRMLDYLISDSGASYVIVHHRVLDRLDPAAMRSIRLAIVVGGGDTRSDLPCPAVTAEEFVGAVASDPSVEDPALSDVACMIYTSGTTGPSKGVLVPWGQLNATSPREWSRYYTADEAQYVPFPMNHVGGKVPPYLMASHGARAVLRPAFSGTEFWHDVRSHGCTLTIMAGTMQSFLWNQPEKPDDADNPLRHVIMLPLRPDYKAFARRFGVRILTGYNMTEISTPLLFDSDIPDWRSCGRLRQGHPGYEVRIVDDRDNEVPAGTVGELIVRTSAPWTLNAGYLGRPESTIAAWRNGWFHTGDAFRCDDDGNYYLVDRLKDAIRRRGENISSVEVESFVNEHPAVLESAAIPVPSDWGEDEVKVVVVLEDGSTLDHADLVRDLADRMPRYMVPRYIEFVAELPKTEGTQRVRKVELKEAPFTAATWDRETAGIAVPR